MASKRILGQQLVQHVGSEVIVLGLIKKVSSTGKTVEMLTTDNVTVNVTLSEAIDGICEGYIEVYGQAVSKSTISCNSYVVFPPQASNNFESDKYNTLLSTLRVLGDKKWKLNEKDAPY